MFENERIQSLSDVRLERPFEVQQQISNVADAAAEAAHQKACRKLMHEVTKEAWFGYGESRLGGSALRNKL